MCNATCTNGHALSGYTCTCIYNTCIHVYIYTCIMSMINNGTTKQCNTTLYNNTQDNSFSKEKLAAQVGFKPTTLCSLDKLYVYMYMSIYMFTATDVWQCSSSRGGVSAQPLGSLFSAHQHSRDSPDPETAGHCLFLPPQQRQPGWSVSQSVSHTHTHTHSIYIYGNTTVEPCL